MGTKFQVHTRLWVVQTYAVLGSKVLGVLPPLDEANVLSCGERRRLQLEAELRSGASERSFGAECWPRGECAASRLDNDPSTIGHAPDTVGCATRDRRAMLSPLYTAWAVGGAAAFVWALEGVYREQGGGPSVDARGIVHAVMADPLRLAAVAHASLAVIAVGSAWCATQLLGGLTRDDTIAARSRVATFAAFKAVVTVSILQPHFAVPLVVAIVWYAMITALDVLTMLVRRRLEAAPSRAAAAPPPAARLALLGVALACDVAAACAAAALLLPHSGSLFLILIVDCVLIGKRSDRGCVR